MLALELLGSAGGLARVGALGALLLVLVALARLGLGLSEVFGAGGSTAVAAARLSPNAGYAALTVVVGLLVTGAVLFVLIAPDAMRIHQMVVNR